MSYLDAELIFSGTKASGAAALVGQRVNAAGVTTNGSYDIDTLAAGDAIKSGAYFKAIATEVCAGTGTTLTISLVTDSDVAFGSATTLFTTGAIAKANTAAGTILCQVPIPVGVERYLRVIYTCDSTSFETTGKVAAFIVLNPEKTLDRQM